MRIIITALLAFSLSACLSLPTSDEQVVAIKPDLPKDQIEAWNKMLGKWYGAQPMESGETYEWVVTRTVEGRFKLEARQSRGEIYTEVGEWGLAGPIYFVIAKGWVENEIFIPTDPTDPYFRHAYEVIELTDSTFKYRAFSDGSIFTMQKVEPDFELKMHNKPL